MLPISWFLLPKASSTVKPTFFVNPHTARLRFIGIAVVVMQLFLANQTYSETVHLAVDAELGTQTNEAWEIGSMGPSNSPDGHTIGYTRDFLTMDGKAWMPVMGEFHFSRYDPASWELELRKMKAGGIDVVATYVFWIHHEEKEGQWQWTSERNLRAFVEAAARADLKVVLRIGPWVSW